MAWARDHVLASVGDGRVFSSCAGKVQDFEVALKMHAATTPVCKFLSEV